MASRSDNLKKLRELNASASLIANKEALSAKQTAQNGLSIPSYSYIAGALGTTGDTYGTRARYAGGTPTFANAARRASDIAKEILAKDTPTIPQQPTQSNVTPVSEVLRNYNWNTGSQYLQPDNPLIQPVQYNNEFSPETTAQMSNAIYNQYYAPLVEQQQKLNTQAYRDAAQTATAQAGAAGMATGSRGAIQAMAQANREAQESNLTYQLQQQQQAFKDTLDARKTELENKKLDYENAWEEIAKYGYVVTDKTGQLLGIQPGQQLTSMEYKTTMTNIAKAVADMEAEKVKLAQNQQQIELTKQSQQETVNNTLYNRLIDMLSRYDTVTPEMAAIGAQVGMRMTVGDYSTNYMSEAEINASKNNQTSYTDKRTIQQISTQIVSTAKDMGGISNPSLFADYIATALTQGLTALQIQQAIRSMSGDDLITNGIPNTNAGKNAAISIINQVVGGTQGTVLSSGMSDSEKNRAENQLVGADFGAGSYLKAVGNLFTDVLFKRGNIQRAGGVSTITVTDSSGNSKQFTMPKTVSGYDAIAPNVTAATAGVLGIGGGRTQAEQYIRENFYNADGTLRSNVRLQYYTF